MNAAAAGPAGVRPARGSYVATAGAWVAGIAFLVAVINAYSYSVVASTPLIQSDAWFFLDGFLGRFIEHGFSFTDLFAQVNPGDTNLPLQKLILLFHTHFFGMDFRIEALFGVVSGILLTVVLARAAAARRISHWTASEFWLLAGLALALLSLNSTNIFTWPLATLWFLPILLGVLYMWYAFSRPSAVGLATAAFTLGIFLDEVSYPVLASVGVALLVLPHCRAPGEFRRILMFSGLGLLASRVVYWGFNHAGAVGVGASVSSETTRSFDAFLDPEVWKAVLFPLSDSVVHQMNLPLIFGANGAAVGTAIGLVLVVAHLWFWARAILSNDDLDERGQALTLLAAALMLLFYGLLAGIVLSRVPVFGFDYLHQPRYVLFYELNLAALALMFYRDYRYRNLRRLGAGLKTVIVAGFIGFAFLQFQLTMLAWEHVKYLSTYEEDVALTMGRLAANPETDMPCADIMTVCNYPPAKRRELMTRLVRYRLNVFSPDFQAFHRLHPTPRPLPPPAKE